MKKRNRRPVRPELIGLLIPLFFAGACLGWAEPMPVLPVAGPAEEPHLGYLVVYSATEASDDGDVMYYTHTDYKLYAPGGAFLRNVRNSIIKGDEAPEKIPLRPGRYLVEAQSENQGIVRVPVIIADGKTTVVNLEGDRRGPNHKVANR